MDANQSLVSEWLAQAGKVAGHDLSLGEDGHCTLNFGDAMECIVEVADGSELVFIYVPLIHLPEDVSQQAMLLKFVMELNLFGLQTGGAVLAYDERTDFILLTFSARLELLDAEIFGRALGDVLDVAVMLNTKIIDFEQSLMGQTSSNIGMDISAIKA